MLAEYMQEERGLNRVMASQPRTYSQFLYNSSLEAHMLTVTRQV